MDNELKTDLEKFIIEIEDLAVQAAEYYNFNISQNKLIKVINNSSGEVIVSFDFELKHIAKKPTADDIISPHIGDWITIGMKLPPIKAKLAEPKPSETLIIDED